MNITRWPILKLDWLYSLQPNMEKPYRVRKTRLGADCGSDYELLIAKFRLKLKKKIGKTTRPWRYDLNQLPYDSTVEVTNKFKELDLIECLKNYGWRFLTLYKRQWSRPSPRKKKCKKAKWLSEEALQIVFAMTSSNNKKRLYTWTSPDGQHWNQIDYILCSQRRRSSIQSAKTRLGADCGSDHELLIAKFRLKLKKVGKTTRPFRYDLNQIPYDYTVEVRNRFKGLDLIGRVTDKLLMELRDIVQETGIKPSPRKRNAKRQNGCPRRPYK